MPIINKAKTTKSNCHPQQESEELLIPIKFITNEQIKNEKEHYQYEKLKHKLKKKITRKNNR